MAAHIEMKHDTDPKKELLKELGNIKDVEIFHNQILCAVYLRPEKTSGGIILPDQAKAEDRYQSKVGLVVRMGPDAFVDDTNTWFKDFKVGLNDWIVFKPSDGWAITVNGVLCRILDDTNVKGRIPNPDQVW
jgi:co-chaperonin GroES (HSP10)